MGQDGAIIFGCANIDLPGDFMDFAIKKLLPYYYNQQINCQTNKPS